MSDEVYRPAYRRPPGRRIFLATSDVVTLVVQDASHAHTSTSPILEPDITQDLIGHWRFTENTGATRNDFFGTNHAADVGSGVTKVTPGLVGSAAAGFNETAYLAVSDNPEISITGSMSFSVEYKDDASATLAFAGIMAKWGHTDQRSYAVYINRSANRFTFQASADGTGATAAVVEADTFGNIPADTKVCIQGYVDLVNDEIGIRVNGGAWDTATYSASGIFDSTASLEFGRLGTSGDVAFGVIDAPWLWARRLPDATFDQVYNSGNGLELSGPAELVVDDSTHSHTAANVSLTQVHALTVADASHAHSADSLVLTQVHTLAIDNAAHGHTAGSPQLTQVHELAVQSGSHAHSAENVTITEGTDLVIQNASHAHTAENLSLTQTHEPAIQNGSHGHTSENLTLTQSHNLTVQGATHDHTGENLALTQAHALSVDGASHSHSAENVSLTQAHQLAIANGAHDHAADSQALTQAHNLVVSNATHAHSGENLVPTQSHALIVANTSHGHSAENLTLSGVHNLSIQSALHPHTAEGLDLSQGHNLGILGVSHAHVASNVVLTSAATLVIANALHGHTAQNVSLTGLLIIKGPTGVILSGSGVLGATVSLGQMGSTLSSGRTETTVDA